MIFTDLFNAVIGQVLTSILGVLVGAILGFLGITV
jgi:hypothetical protein